jgi:hypothetical protein
VNIVTLGWGYVVLMAAIVEACGPQGSILGALVTLLLYGALPIAVLRYISGTAGRRRATAAREAAFRAAAQAAEAGSDGVDPGGGGQAPGEPVAPVGKET